MTTPRRLRRPQPKDAWLSEAGLRRRNLELAVHKCGLELTHWQRALLIALELRG